MPGCRKSSASRKPYKLVSRDVKEENTVIRFPGSTATIGGAGTGHHRRPVRHREPRTGLRDRRARGTRRARSSSAAAPTSRAPRPIRFRDSAKRGWRSWPRFASSFGLKIVTEAIDNESLDLVEEYADMIQIGARNMQNFSLLKRAGRARKPVLLKRGMSATLEELLMAAEYVMGEGNYNVISASAACAPSPTTPATRST